MSWSGLDLVTGCAVDDPQTNIRHQIFSTEFDKKKGLYTLHYSSFYRYVDQKSELNGDDKEKFIQAMSKPTPSDLEECKKMERANTEFFKKVRPGGKNSGFNLNEAAFALTHDVVYSHNYKPVSFSWRPTLAIMTEAITTEEAARRVLSPVKHNPFTVWHNFACNILDKTEGPINFGSVTSRTTTYIQRRARKQSFKDGINTVFRIQGQDYESIDDVMAAKSLSPQEWAAVYGDQYGSVFVEKEKCRKAEGPTKASVGTTATRILLNAYNVAEVFGTLVNNGKSMFEPEIAESVAAYNRNMVVWQRMGLRA